MPTSKSSASSDALARPRHFAVGCAAGVFSAIALQPLDVVKTRMQGMSLFAGKSQNVWIAMKTTYVENGVKGFYKGLLPSVFRSAIGPGFYFVLLEEFKAIGEENPDGLAALWQGATARFLAGALTNPLTVLKTRLEWKTSGTIHNELGSFSSIRGWFKGYVATAFRDVPQAGIHLFCMTYLKSLGLNTTFASLLAGFASTTVTFPADVIKTRIQIHSGKLTFQDLVNLVNKEGYMVLFRGLETRIIRKPLQLCIIWSLYDHLR